MKNTDKIKTAIHDQSDLLGMKPFGSIGNEGVVNSVKSKLKNKKMNTLRAKGSTSQSGEKANVGAISGAIGHFVNK